jgi:hypothetical protein
MITVSKSDDKKLKKAKEKGFIYARLDPKDHVAIKLPEHVTHKLIGVYNRSCGWASHCYSKETNSWNRIRDERYT